MAFKYIKTDNLKLEQLSTGFISEMIQSFYRYEAQQYGNPDLCTTQEEEDFICSYLCF